MTPHVSPCSSATIAPLPGGCAFAEDPGRASHTARLFWDAAIDPRVIVADAHATDRNDPERFDPLALAVPATILLGHDREELLLGDGDRSVRISIAQGSVLHGPVKLGYRLTGTDALDLRLLALRRLAALMVRGRLPAHLFEPHARSGRWIRLVATLEAMAADPSHLSVATTLYGKPLVELEWTGESDFLRSRVRRLVAQARRLASGGHASLLRR